MYSCEPLGYLRSGHTICFRSLLAYSGDAGLCTTRVSLLLLRDSAGNFDINGLEMSMQLFGTLRLRLPYCLRIASSPTRQLFIMGSVGYNVVRRCVFGLVILIGYTALLGIGCWMRLTLPKRTLQ